MFDFQKFIDEAIASRPVEARITRKVIRALKKNGTPVVKTWDHEEYVAVRTERDILEQVFNLDDVFLITESGSWVRLMPGNGEDIITDYTVDLEDALDGIGG